MTRQTEITRWALLQDSLALLCIVFMVWAFWLVTSSEPSARTLPAAAERPAGAIPPASAGQWGGG